MLRFLIPFILGSLFAFATSVANDHQRAVKFVTLEWPPYLGANLPHQGIGIQILKAALKAEGYNNIEISFLPWSRALKELQNNSDIAGCLLAYYSEDRTKIYHFSDPLTVAPIHFAFNKSHPVNWKNLSDLKAKRVGVVQDYVNTDELDELLSKKIIIADSATSDLNNIEKLARQRTDLAVIDKNVFTYLVKTAPELNDYRDELKLDARSLDDKKLYVLFSQNKKYASLIKDFNKGLKKINPAKMTKDYIDKL